MSSAHFCAWNREQLNIPNISQLSHTYKTRSSDATVLSLWKDFWGLYITLTSDSVGGYSSLQRRLLPTNRLHWYWLSNSQRPIKNTEKKRKANHNTNKLSIVKTKPYAKIKRKPTGRRENCSCLWLCTTVLHNTAQNSSDNLPSYSPDNHHSSDVVALILIKEKLDDVHSVSGQVLDRAAESRETESSSRCWGVSTPFCRTFQPVHASTMYVNIHL